MSEGIRSSGFSVWRLVSRSVLLWVSLIFFILGMVITGIGIQTASTEQAYRTKGVMVDATVLDKSIERAKRGEHSRTRYLVSYRFLSEQGQSIESVTEVPVEEWEGLEAGRTFRMTYLPDSPETSRVEGENEWIGALVLMGVGGIFTLIGGGLAFTDVRSILRVIRVSRHGFLTKGTVVRAEPTSTTINRVPQWRVYYRYRDNLGSEQEGASQLMPPEEGRLWIEGDTGTVRYDEKSPSISVWMGKS
jgi:hypothetical protein